ncbi:transmembrane protein 218 [Pterocles gutturalis]
MAGRVLGLGPGVLVLLLLWALALLLCLAISRAAGRARFAVVLVTLGAAVLSAALLLFPREDEHPAPAAADQVITTLKSGAICVFRQPLVCVARHKISPDFGSWDTLIIARFVLLAVMSLVLLGCLFLFLVYHLMEPVYGKPLAGQLAAAIPAKRKSRFHGDKPGRETRRLLWR